MKIDRERMEQAVMYLADTDIEYAHAKALYEGLVEQKKIVKSNHQMRSAASSVSAKEAEAYSSMAYQHHLTKIQDANVTFLILQAKRQTECTIIDCWRSLNAARNKGQIV